MSINMPNKTISQIRNLLPRICSTCGRRLRDLGINQCEACLNKGKQVNEIKSVVGLHISDAPNPLPYETNS